VPVSVRVAPMYYATGQIIGAVEIFTDVTAQMKVARRAAKFEKLAFQDLLTGINNRRFIDLKIRQAILEVAEFKRQFGILAIDVDYFKKINDLYGHEIGDQVLRSISRLLLSSVRPEDFVGRWGGEEFLALIADVFLA
jgi:diguanylate cyclase (GGDEF)-like protein